jgi:tRNA(fMet)-specific endonuclease VapC
MNHVLLDTNAYSHLMAGNQSVLTIISEADIVYMSVFVIGELLTGFKGGKHEQRNREILNHFLKKQTVKILSATMDTSEFFSDIKHTLRKAGKPLPINDIWIASHCLQSGSMIITFDAHFKEIPGLLVWNHCN